MSPNHKYEPIIGLEVHAQLLTESKAFCRCSTKFGEEPNSNVCPVCLGLPGVLPVLNRQVVDFTIRMGLATHCAISARSVFARKNYFYPDLPKGYQISQYEEPICTDGYVEIELKDGTKKKIGITRIHMEEDAGKSIHDLDVDTLVDVNRCGVPLIEIVSEPDMRSPQEAYQYLYKIRQLVTYLGICDGNMEEGSLRCDANISVRKQGEKQFGTKTELKNMNSFRFVEKALEYEISRQIDVLESGGTVIQETLLWNADEGIAIPMRSKEEAHDYRYFPEPDLVPVLVDKDWVDKVRATLPKLPDEKEAEYVNDLKLPKYDARVLTSEMFISQSFDIAKVKLKNQNEKTFKLLSNRMMTDFLRYWNAGMITKENQQFASASVSGIVNMQDEGIISSTTGSFIFTQALQLNKDPNVIVDEQNLGQVSDVSLLEKIVEDILTNNKEQVEKYLGGKEQLFGFLVGETMKAMKGRANPKIVNEILRKKLAELREKR